MMKCKVWSKKVWSAVAHFAKRMIIGEANNDQREWFTNGRHRFVWTVAVLLCTAFAAQASVTVTNVTAAQLPGTKTVQITYDVSGTETNTLTVSLAVMDGTNAVACPGVSGDVGAGVATGTGKTIVWDGGADWDGNVATLLYTVLADDGVSQGSASAVCPVEKTGQTYSYRTGDDGDLQPGAAWPDPRFTDNGDGTVLDNLTGLEWVKAPHGLPGNSGTMVWNSAVDFCSALSYAGYDDWRLPSIKELQSLVHFGNGSWGDRPFEWLNSSETPFTGVQRDFYWSGTCYASYTPYAWRVDMYRGGEEGYYKTNINAVWPVRSR